MIPPTPFKIYLKSAFKKLLLEEVLKRGIKLDEKNISTLLFSDDQVIITVDTDDMTYI